MDTICQWSLSNNAELYLQNCNQQSWDVICQQTNCPAEATGIDWTLDRSHRKQYVSVHAAKAVLRTGEIKESGGKWDVVMGAGCELQSWKVGWSHGNIKLLIWEVSWSQGRWVAVMESDLKPCVVVICSHEMAIFSHGKRYSCMEAELESWKLFTALIVNKCQGK